MNTLKNTKENNAMVAALKKINQCYWVGNTVHDTLEKCLRAINNESLKNSGWYNPVGLRIAGLEGVYLLNEDGSFCFDYRVIKESENKFKIETMAMKAYNDFESFYLELLK